ncbi:hypothetical protein [Marilutibacter maris]|uniref:hypothetical protein n=1 Tax=Marilutibacter maris TaxID=1605891 RepID=UPI000DAAB9CB|nr:hypothetical protein [Lysobacter maris]
MSKREQSGPKVTRTASSVLRDPAKSLAGSALAQVRTAKQSSSATARTAGKALNDGRTSTSPRSLAGSVLTQKPKR